MRSLAKQTYQTLLEEIAKLYTQTQATVVRMYWEIGRRIVEVEQQGDKRAEYGGQLLERLSSDLTKRFGSGFSWRNLHRMRRFYLQNKILPTSAELTWSHQTELMSAPNAKVRKKLAAEARRRNLSAHQLRALIQRRRRQLGLDSPSNNGTAHSDHKTPSQEFLKPRQGKPGFFKIKKINDTLFWDLGFESYRELTSTQKRSFKEGDIVKLTDKGSLKVVPEASTSELYTYDARLIRVVDGDTLWMLICLAGTDWRREKLRLRGIDTPELGTTSGDSAKRFVQSLFKKADSCLITTTKPDKWDRYLSDVFLTTSEEAIFLNNRLLETGHARRYKDVEKEDWE